MEEIYAIARGGGRSLIVIEDACHALGAEWMDSRGAWSKVGACTHSDMAVFSFHPVKSITTGEGGAVTTNDEGLYKRLKLMRNHGMTRDLSADEFQNRWYYEMHEPGFNFRLTDIQCALGVSQLNKIDRFIKRRAEIAATYTENFKDLPYIKTPAEPEGFKSAHHLYPVEIDFEGLVLSRSGWFESMAALGIQPQVHYIPVHLQPYYRRRFGLREGDLLNAERFYKGEVSLPIYPLLTDRDVAKVTEAVVSTLERAAAGGAGHCKYADGLSQSGGPSQSGGLRRTV
jgi:dTDP-4-amino-4,6-dideoxygalactose transaminase